MADNTSRFGLNTYSQGDDNWSHNDTVKLLDELAENRDVKSNRPTSGTYDNEVYHATDENIFYRWDSGSSSWVAVGGKGGSGSPVPGTTYLERASITNPTTVYVRSTGSDSNTGASASDAKATIMAAVDDAPVQSYGGYIVIDIQESATFSEQLDFGPYHPPVKLIGNGKANTTIDATGNTFDAYGATVVFADLTVSGGTYPRVNEGARFGMSNAKITGMSDRGLSVANDSFAKIDGTSVVDVAATTASNAITVGDASVRIHGTATGGETAVVEAEENSTVWTQNALIEGEGPATTSYGIAVGENSYAKVHGGDELKDVDSGVYLMGGNAGAEIESGVTQTNINRLKRFGTSAQGYINDMENGEILYTVPALDGMPNPAGLGNGYYEGLFAVDRTASSGLAKYYSRAEGDYLLGGAKEYADPASTDLEARERAFDTTNLELLYKDTGGSVNQFPNHSVVKDVVNTVASGGTTTVQLSSTGEYLGSDLEVTAVPNADPGNDVGFIVDKIWYDTSASGTKVQVSETEGAGGGDVRVRVFKRGA